MYNVIFLKINQVKNDNVITLLKSSKNPSPNKKNAADYRFLTYFCQLPEVKLYIQKLQLEGHKQSQLQWTDINVGLNLRDTNCL